MMRHPTVTVEEPNESNTARQGDETRQKVVLTLPVTIPDAVRETVLSRLADQFGGFTLTESRGGWVNPDGELITERVVQAEAIRTAEDQPDARAVAQSTARWVQAKTDEETVMWEVTQTTAGFEGEG